jgi:hypothetical protein
VFPLESKFAAEYVSLVNAAGVVYSTREHLVLAGTSISSQDAANSNTIRQIVQLLKEHIRSIYPNVND